MTENDEGLGQLVELQFALDKHLGRADLKNKFGIFLKRNGVFTLTTLYRFIPSANKSRDNLVTQGTDHPEFDSIFAFSYEKIFTRNTLLPTEYLFNYAEPGCPYSCMVALYDGGQFIDDNLNHYTFRNPEFKLQALKAVVYINPTERIS